MIPAATTAYAFELVETVRAHRRLQHRCRGAPRVASPVGRSPRQIGERLAEKLEAADFGVTQFFFDADDYFRMVDELDALGCRTPVLPGSCRSSASRE